MKVFVGSFELKERSVIISDPCYRKGVWRQRRLDNVRVGVWKAVVNKENGTIVELITYYKGSVSDLISLEDKWEERPFTIEVDSGQAGIFQESVFRNDNTSLDVPDLFEDREKRFEGDRRYGACCTLL